MAFTSRSTQSVRRLGPESSRLLRDAEDLKDRGFTSAANQVALQAAQLKRSESPVDTPALRESREAAQRAIAMGQQIGIQGDFDPAEVVAPLKQKFLGSLSGLPSAQQSALLNRFEPQFRQQRILQQAEQKSFLDLKEAQRKARLTQATDALQAPVAARIEKLMSSGVSATEKQQELNRVIFQNPDVLRSPEMIAVFNTANNSLNKKLDSKSKKENNLNAKKFSLTQQAVAAGTPSLIPALWGAKNPEDLVPLTQKIAKEYETKQQATKADESLTAMMKSITASDMSAADKQVILSKLQPRTIGQLGQIQTLQQVAVGEARKEGRQATIQQIDGLIDLVTAISKDEDLVGNDKEQAVEDLIEQIELAGIVPKGDIKSGADLTTIQAILLGKKFEISQQNKQVDFSGSFDRL